MASSDYREAHAEAQAARARANALRPWYRKKRYLLGIPLAVFAGLVLLSAATSTDEDTTPGTASDAAGASAAGAIAGADSRARLGDLVRVGSLDLTVTKLSTAFDAGQYNRANRATVAIAFRATNARGDEGKEYEFLLNAFKVVDTAGVTYPRAICIDCPGEFATRGLVRGGTLEGAAYFEIPAGATLTELIYDPLFSNNKARISLR